MPALRLPKHAAETAFLASSVLTATATWIFLHEQGKNGFDTFPLVWLVAIVCAPALSFACVVAIWRQRKPVWIGALAALLLLPQCVVWYFAVLGTLHYLGYI